MDVDTAPLLVKRRGMKRNLEKDLSQKCITSSGRCTILESVPENSTLANIPKQSVNSSFCRPSSITLNLLSPQQDDEAVDKTPVSAAFTEYRDTRPPYLKYSRDDDCTERTRETHSSYST